MSETGTEHVDSSHRTRIHLLLLHSVQLIVAVVVLGLDSYGIQYIPYNALIYSLAVAICTLLVCPYLLASQLHPGKLCNIYVSVGLHFWMLVFWSVNTGILIDLAKVWSQPGCTYTPWDGYACSSYWKRDQETLSRRDTSYGPYYGALVAGAALAGAEILMWVCTTALLLCNAKKSRSNETDSPPLPVARRPVGGHVEKQQSAPDPWDGGIVSTVRDGPQPLLPSPPVSPEVQLARTDTYFQSGSSEQPPETAQVPPPWTNLTGRMSNGDPRQIPDKMTEKIIREQIEMVDRFKLPTRIPTDHGISSRRKS